MVKPVRQTLDFLGQPFETDALKAKVEGLRDEIRAKAEAQEVLITLLELNVADLTILKAKTDFLANLMGRELDMFVPPEPEGVEKEYDAREKAFYDPLENVALGIGGIGGALYIGAKAIPFTLKGVVAITKISKLANWAGNAKWAKAAKLGKSSVYLALAIVILEAALKMVSAKKINDHLRAREDELEEQIVQADLMLVRIETALAESRIQREKLLFDLGFGPFVAPDHEDYPVEIATAVSEYLRRANTSGEEITVNATVKKSVRNLVIMGQTPEAIVDLLGPIYEDVTLPMVQALARRVQAELLLLDGMEQDDIAREVGISTFQVAVIARVLRARADGARGYPDEVLSERYGISDAVADLQIDLAESAMAQVWDEIALGSGDAVALSRTTLVPPEALADVMREVPARMDFLDGASPETVAANHPEISAERIAELHEDMQVRAGAMLEDVAASQATRPLTDNQRLLFAVALRVPLSAIPTAQA